MKILCEDSLKLDQPVNNLSSDLVSGCPLFFSIWRHKINIAKLAMAIYCLAFELVSYSCNNAKSCVCIRERIETTVCPLMCKRVCYSRVILCHVLVCESDCKILDIPLFKERLNEAISYLNDNSNPLVSFAEPNFRTDTTFFDKVSNNLIECDNLINAHCYLVNKNSKDQWDWMYKNVGWHAYDWWVNYAIEEYNKFHNPSYQLCFNERITHQFDGLSDIDISALIKFHKQHGKHATLTAVRPPGRYGALKFGSNDSVDYFQEKPEGDGSWVNGGFFILNPVVIDRIKDDQSSWEKEPLVGLAKDHQLYAFRHDGFWQPMDTLREKIMLNELWEKGVAPWKTWK